jgi:hypothetical protein
MTIRTSTRPNVRRDTGMNPRGASRTTGALPSMPTRHLRGATITRLGTIMHMAMGILME